ncbi:MAG: SprT-like domain-containing protein [Gammaproteobacteria bacterium]|nr:SprT-like domain-containing protein [Gammaproteobacteria bacterium]
MTQIIQPIDQQQQLEVIQRVDYYLQRAAEIYQQDFSAIPVYFDLKGRAAGMYLLQRQQRWIRFNPYIFSRYFDDCLHSTVPHEVAHYVTDMVHGLARIRPHGVEWKALMRALGSEPRVRADYSLEGMPVRRQQRFAYRCDCREHEITITRHKKICSKRMRYFCQQCGAAIVAIS